MLMLSQNVGGEPDNSDNIYSHASNIFKAFDEIVRKLEEDVTLTIESEILGASASQQRQEKQAIRFSIWDMAGQTVFYDLLNLLLTEYAIYIVCFDMEEMINDTANCLTYIKFWLTTIHLHAPGAPIFIIGTHKDVPIVSTQKEHEKISMNLRNELRDHPAMKRLVFHKSSNLWFFPVDNKFSQRDPTIPALRECLLKTAEEQDFLKLKIPLTWLVLLDNVKAIARDQKLTHISLTELQNIGTRLGIDNIQFNRMLRVFHQFGHWLHFPNPGLYDIIVFDPQWIIYNITCIIRDFNLHSNENLLEGAFSDELGQLQDKGHLYEELIPKLWSSVSEAERDFLLKLMMMLQFLLPLRLPSYSRRSTPLYLVPALLPPYLLEAEAEDRLSEQEVPLYGFGFSRLDSDRHSDGLSTQYAIRQPTYTGPRDDLVKEGWCEWYYFFSLKNNKILNSSLPFKVKDLERTGVLPNGLFLRSICEIVRYQQFTSKIEPKLSQNSILVFQGPVKVRIDIMPAIFCIRVQAKTEYALPVKSRLNEAFDAVLIGYPNMCYTELVPFNKNLLLPLASVQQVCENRSEFSVDDELMTYQQLKNRFQSFIVRRGQLQHYHIMLSYRRDVNSNFVSIFNEALCQQYLPDGKPVTVFYDQASIETGNIRCRILPRHQSVAPCNPCDKPASPGSIESSH